jgi:hypothetical protein
VREPRDTGWFTSSYSGSGNDQCVECRLTPVSVAVRDSKHRGSGRLALTPAAWHEFLSHLR